MKRNSGNLKKIHDNEYEIKGNLLSLSNDYNIPLMEENEEILFIKFFHALHNFFL